MTQLVHRIWSAFSMPPLWATVDGLILLTRTTLILAIAFATGAEMTAVSALADTYEAMLNPLVAALLALEIVRYSMSTVPAR